MSILSYPPPFHCLCMMCCFFKCKPQSNYTLNYSQHTTRNKMVEAKEYSHHKIFLFEKKRGIGEITLLSLVTIRCHISSCVFQGPPDVVVEGVSSWAKMAALFCFESFSLIYCSLQHVRWAVQYISFLGAVFIVIAHFFCSVTRALGLTL